MCYCFLKINFKMVVKKMYILLVIIGAVYCEGRALQFNGTGSRLSKSLINVYDPSQYFGVPGSEMLFKEKCERNGVSTSFFERDLNREEVQRCQINLFDNDGLLDNYQDGQIRDAMKTFCAKTPQYNECSNILVAGLRPCFSADERPYLENFRDGERRVYDFVCYNDGERVIRFLEEGGPECVQKQEERIKTCFDMMEKVPWSDVSVSDAENAMSDDNMFQGLVVKQLCTEFLEIRSCVVDALRRCERQQHADFVDSLTDVVFRATPCKDQMPSRGLGVGAVVAIVMGVVLLVVLTVGGYRWWRKHAGAVGGGDAKLSGAGAGPGAVGLLS